MPLADTILVVFCHEIVGLTRFRERKQEIVRGIGGAFHARQRADILGQFLQLVDQTSSLVRFDALCDPRLAQRSPQFGELLRANQQREKSLLPCAIDPSRTPGSAFRPGPDRRSAP